MAASLFLIQGQQMDLGLLVPVACGALLSVPFSAQVVKRLDDKLIKSLIATLTLGLGTLTLVRSFLWAWARAPAATPGCASPTTATGAHVTHDEGGRGADALEETAASSR